MLKDNKKSRFSLLFKENFKLLFMLSLETKVTEKFAAEKGTKGINEG